MTDKQLTDHLTQEDAHQMYLDALKELLTRRGLNDIDAIDFGVAYAYEQGRRDEKAERGQ